MKLRISQEERGFVLYLVLYIIYGSWTLMAKQFSFEHHVTMMRNNVRTNTLHMNQQTIQIIQHFADLHSSFIVVLIALYRLLDCIPCCFCQHEVHQQSQVPWQVHWIKLWSTHVYAALEHCPKLETVDATCVLWSFALRTTNSEVDFCFQWDLEFMC